MSLSVSAGHTLGPDVDDDPILALPPPAQYSGIRLPDGRALAWCEYGDPRGVPCVLIPDVGSSRLAPRWLLHDTALPDGIRLIALDPPGIGASDARPTVAVGATRPGRHGSRPGPDVDDLGHLVQTLAVGQVVVIGIGGGADAALALADRRPQLVASAAAVSLRMGSRPAAGRHRHADQRSRRTRSWQGPLAEWARAAGRHDLTQERTWARARNRMTPGALAALGNRWREPDFRRAVADDLALSVSVPEEPAARALPDWVDRWSSDTPVRCWHGWDDPGTDVATLRELAAGRRQWTVTAVPGGGALLGTWPAILTDQRTRYLAGPR